MNQDDEYNCLKLTECLSDLATCSLTSSFFSSTVKLYHAATRTNMSSTPIPIRKNIQPIHQRSKYEIEHSYWINCRLQNSWINSDFAYLFDHPILSNSAKRPHIPFHCSSMMPGAKAPGLIGAEVPFQLQQFGPLALKIVLPPMELYQSTKLWCWELCMVRGERIQLYPTVRINVMS